jgi:hypothetical protein
LDTGIAFREYWEKRLNEICDSFCDIISRFEGVPMQGIKPWVAGNLVGHGQVQNRKGRISYINILLIQRKDCFCVSLLGQVYVQGTLYFTSPHG